MDIIEGPLFVETVPGTQNQASQPPVLAGQTAALPQFDDAAVRAAIASAEASGQNPESLKIADLSQGQPAPQTSPAPVAEAPRLDIPEKFLKPDGVVDVEKLQASTRQLDEALKAKETAVNKSVEDYVRAYKDKEAKFRALPNPERLAANMPSAPPPPVQQIIDTPANMTEFQIQEMINRDIQANPAATVAQLIQIALDRRFQPIEADRRDANLRENVAKLAEQDPRVLDQAVFNAINAKLEAEPDLWNRKNPHRAAWLEVKDEMRLGDAPARTSQAQPSKAVSPILGGGIPPSAPSSFGLANPQRVVSSLDQLDVRDKKQEAAGDEALRALFARER